MDSTNIFRIAKMIQIKHTATSLLVTDKNAYIMGMLLVANTAQDAVARLYRGTSNSGVLLAELRLNGLTSASVDLPYPIYSYGGIYLYVSANNAVIFVHYIEEKSVPYDLQQQANNTSEHIQGSR